jgi:hypothetical protein
MQTMRQTQQTSELEQRAHRKPNQGAEQAQLAADNLDRLPSNAGSARQAAVLQMQRQFGNAFVQRMLAGKKAPEAIQRQPTTTDTEPVAGAAGGSSELTGPGGVVSVGGGGLEMTAPMANVHAAIATFDGVVRANTLIADTVVGSSYTPGAGNIW